MPAAVSELLASTRALYDERHLLEVESRRVHFPDEVRVSKCRRVAGEGTAHLKYLFDLLDSFGMKRSNVQKQLHLGMVGTPSPPPLSLSLSRYHCSLFLSAPSPSLHFSTPRAGSVMQRIFCSDSDAEMKLAMSRYKIQSSRQQFMAITPRRFG
jgi:hypothetical protein